MKINVKLAMQLPEIARHMDTLEYIFSEMIRLRTSSSPFKENEFLTLREVSAREGFIEAITKLRLHLNNKDIDIEDNEF